MSSNIYITVEQFKATAELTGTNFLDADAQASLAAACRAIDNLCNRPHGFWEDEVDTVRYFTPYWQDRMEITDLSTLTTLQTDPSGTGTFDATWTLNTDFYLAPLNADTDGQPWTQLIVAPVSGRYLFPGFPRSVKVTGRFGWATVPDGIVEYTSVLTAKLLRRKREPQAALGYLNVGDQAVRIARTDPQFAELVGPYVLHRIAVG